MGPADPYERAVWLKNRVVALRAARDRGEFTDAQLAAEEKPLVEELRELTAKLNAAKLNAAARK